MFYLGYLKAELTRRLGKTVSISLGLAIASLIIIVIISVSQALSSAQETVLNPLKNVGTDIMVSRSVNAENMRDLDEATRAEFQSENRVSTDLSKLGDPGQSFTNDIFLPGEFLTFDQNVTEKLDKNLVAKYAPALILNVTHQEGTIPNIVAEVQTGGEEIEMRREIEPMTPEEQAAVDAARTKAQQELQEKGIDPKSEEGRNYIRQATEAAMPERFKNQTFKFTNPSRTYRQNIGAISTDIKTTTMTVGGVDVGKGDIGLILSSQIVEGSNFNGGDQIIVNKSYASKNNIKVGDKFKLAQKECTVVGLVEPKLYSNMADLYLPLGELQKLAGKENRINLILVKSTEAKSVSETSQALSGLFAGAQVSDAQETAKQVSGSLISAANLTSRFILTASAVVVLAAFIIVSLLTVSSINKRTREIGTLKAIGWSNLEVTRQIALENLSLGIIGALVGIGLGVLIIFLLNRFGLSLSASIAKSGLQGMMGRFRPGSEGVEDSISALVELKIAYNYLILLLGAAVAILGATVSGLIAALKVSNLKPQIALRNVE
ncbi:MAG: FtsX-like permease family protein [Candidatus Berkelbacteria bacterium]|nr:FtsX-like permease family protein [Candidatus Berkelbacteria bacterium]